MKKFVRTAFLNMIRDHAYQTGQFTLASGKTSDFYLDLRKVILSSEGHRILSFLISDALLPEIQAVAGVALGGCPLASMVATAVQMPAIYIRPQPKTHGSGNQIELPFDFYPSAEIALLEDTLTTGGSAERAVLLLREQGFKVPQVVAVADREEGAVARLEALGLQVKALYTLSEIRNV